MQKKEYIQGEIEKQVANRIKKLRVEAGYSSYEQFAIEHNIDRKQYWRMENGANFTLKSLVIIMNIHKINLSDFFESL